jgi:predicted GIY-YIG superfamily endonuclease
MPYYVYILACADGTYYTGMTSNLKRRITNHMGGYNKRAYTYSRRPVSLVWAEELSTEDEAKAREKQIKPWQRKRKDSLVMNHSDETSRLAVAFWGRDITADRE